MRNVQNMNEKINLYLMARVERYLDRVSEYLDTDNNNTCTNLKLNLAGSLDNID